MPIQKFIKTILGILALLPTPIFPQDAAVLKYMQTITSAELSEHVHTLASPGLEGRYTGSEGQRLAAEYIRKDFIAAGLENPYPGEPQAYLQPFALDKCYWHEQTINIGNIGLQPLEDFVMLSEPIEAEGGFEVVFLGYGIDDPAYSDYAGQDVQGKLVMALPGEPRNRQGFYLVSGNKEPSRKRSYYSKMETAKEKGAAGLILISPAESDFHKLAKEHETYLTEPEISYPGNETDSFFVLVANDWTAERIIPSGSVVMKEAREYIRREGKPYPERPKGSLVIVMRKECYPLNTENVVAIVPGTGRGEKALVIVAHYDHFGIKDGKLYPGADDNASGTAAVMELAEAFAAAARDGIRPLRTIVFLAVTAEEIGLYGSRYYSENPVVPADSTYACLNIDMIGRTATRSKDDPMYIGGWTYISRELFEIVERTTRTAAPGLAFRMTYRERAFGGSDHYYFARSGIPSVFYFTGIHNDYHAPGDTPEKLLYGRMEMTVRAIFATAWELANRPGSWSGQEE